MAKFDLTAKNCQYLDRHLTFPLLEFLLQKNVSWASSSFYALQITAELSTWL